MKINRYFKRINLSPASLDEQGIVAAPKAYFAKQSMERVSAKWLYCADQREIPPDYGIISINKTKRSIILKKFFLCVTFLLSIIRVSADDFSDRFLNKKWILEYYNEIIYYEDRDLLLDYIPKYKNQKEILFKRASLLDECDYWKNKDIQIENLYFKFDGDYLYIFLNESNNLLTTYCAYEENEYTSLIKFLQTNDILYNSISLPRHADGSCDYDGSKN